MANHKPGSVPVAARSIGVYHLSSAALTRSVNRPTLRDERAARSACADPGIFGLSARKVYPAKCITAQAVSSYLTFSPFPRQAEVVCFLWHLLFCSNSLLQPFPLRSTMLFAARTFLFSNEKR